MTISRLNSSCRFKVFYKSIWYYFYIFLKLIIFVYDLNLNPKMHSKYSRILLMLFLWTNYLSLAQDLEVNYYLEKAEELKKFDKDSALLLLAEGISEFNQKKEPASLAQLYYKKSKIFDFYSLWDSSFVYYQKAAPLFEKVKDSINAAKCYINIGVTHYYYGDNKKALKNYKKASDLLKTSNEFILRAKALNNIALIYKSEGDYQSAIKNFHQSIDLKTKAGDEEGIASCYQNIGVIYWEQKNYKEALQCYSKVTETLQSLNKFDDLAGVYTDIGLIYSSLKDTAQALLYYDKSNNLYRQTDNMQGQATVYLNKATLLEKPDFYDETEVLLLKALDIFQQTGYSKGVYNCKINLSHLYSLIKNHKKAIKYGLEALNMKEDKSLKNLAEGYYILSENYFDMKNYSLAYHYLKKYTEINDTIFNLEKNRQINDLRTKYETDKKEAQITILKQKAEIQALELEKKQERIENITLFFIIVTVFSIIALILYLQKRASYLKLVKQNVELAKTEKKAEKIDSEKAKQQIQKYKDTNLTEEQKQELIENIISLMENEKYYRSEQFTIRDFAQELNSNRNYLSQIINEYFKTNFTNFVNEYRVKEARQLLIDGKYSQYTIEAIGNMVGFHSKGTFNSAFKKFTGVTPSFFRKNA
ncbi:MAG: AraC family transcriptional regulator [Chlorobi bacterium]|nr:AraC family transcriptional regulator [Chlorobiota bacterium]